MQVEADPEHVEHGEAQESHDAGFLFMFRYVPAGQSTPPHFPFCSVKPLSQSVQVFSPEHVAQFEIAPEHDLHSWFSAYLSASQVSALHCAASVPLFSQIWLSAQSASRLHVTHAPAPFDDVPAGHPHDSPAAHGSQA